MPAWSPKDERQYEAIKESAVDRGTPEEEAKEIAGRTVNKRRREEGRTPNRSTQGTGNPNKPPRERSRDELRNLARELDIPGRSQMSKEQLVRAVERKQG